MSAFGAGWRRGKAEERDGLAFGAALLFTWTMFASAANLWPPLDRLRPALATSVIAAGALVLGRVARRRPLSLDGGRGGALVALAGLALASASWSVYPAISHDTGVELLKDSAIYLTLVNLVTSARRMRWILIACLVGAIAPSYGAIQNYLAGTNLVDGFRARWEGVYADPNHLAMSLVILVPVGMAMLLRGRGWERALGAVSMPLAVMAIVVTHSRGGAVGLGVAVVIWALREEKRLRALCGVGLLAVAMALFAPKSFWSRTETIADYEEDVSAQGRVHAWEVAAAIGRDRPVLGVGAGAFRFAWPLYAPPEARGTAFVAHNVFIGMLAELGMVGFLLFVGFVGSALGGAYAAGRRGGGAIWARAVHAGACGYVVCDMSSGYLLSAHFFFVFALLAAAHRIGSAELAPAPRGEALQTSWGAGAPQAEAP